MKLLSITGGKGGIGKTTISINLSLALSKLKKKVLLFDADLGLANVDIMLDLHPIKTLKDYINATASIDEICVPGPEGIQVIPGSSGVEDMANLNQEQVMNIINGFSALSGSIDIMLTDLASGISMQNVHLTLASQEIILVICDEPAAIMDSYAILKLFSQKYGRTKFGIIVNKAKDLKNSYSTFIRFQDVCEQFMNVSLHYLGFVPADDYVLLASREHKPVTQAYPFSPASRAYDELAKSVLSWLDDAAINGGIQYFYENQIETKTLKG